MLRLHTGESIAGGSPGSQFLGSAGAPVGGAHSVPLKDNVIKTKLCHPRAGLQQQRYDNREVGQGIRLRAQMVQRPDCAGCADIKVPAASGEKLSSG
jgi:hypothetical protein